MQPSPRSRWPASDIIALVVVNLCALIVLAALLHPASGFEQLLPLVLVLLARVAWRYFKM